MEDDRESIGMTRDPTLFEMPESYRGYILQYHDFYVAQAKQRILSQFKAEDIRAEADRAGEEFLENNRFRFNPDVSCGNDFLAQAEIFINGLYSMLTRMREAILLNVISELYFSWEKSLRDWLLLEIARYPWCRRDGFGKAVSKMKIENFINLFMAMGFDVKNRVYFDRLDACRLVVNVHKHGNGESLTNLGNKYPCYLKHPLGGLSADFEEEWGHEHLSVSDEDMNSFAAAIRDFWVDFPEEVRASNALNLPKWFYDDVAYSVWKNQ